MLRKGAIVQLAPPWDPGFYSHLFMVPKKTGGLRPVIDLKRLNTFLAVPSFKMETVQQIRSQLRQGEWVVKLDMKDAYFHIPVHAAFQRYLRFAVAGRVYQFVAMCFGLSPAPLIFTKVLRALASYLRLLGFLIHLFLDDWLLRAKSPQELRARTKFLLALAARLGIIINVDKSDLTPRQIFEYLGFLFNLVRGLVFPTLDAIAKLKHWIRFLQSQTHLPARGFLSLLGFLNNLCQAVPLGRLHLRPLQWYLKCFWRPHIDPLEAQIPLRPAFFQALAWWGEDGNTLQGSPLHLPDPQICVVTDASLHGWGGHCQSQSAKGSWSQQDSLLHINNLEMKAVLRCLQAFLPLVQGKVVLIMSDNTTVVSHIKREGGTHSWDLYLLTRELFAWCQHHNVTLRVSFIPGRLNSWADSLSRPGQILKTEWCLHRSAFQAILRFCPSLQVDLFATSLNARLPTYVSPCPDDNAWAHDALSLSWEGLIAYAYPPISLIPVILRKIADQDCVILLIAPLWPAQPWYPTLLDLLVDVPLALPRFRRLLRQPHEDVYHTGLDVLNLHVWPLSSRSSLKTDFLRRLRTGLPPASDGRLFRYINPISRHSSVGCVAGQLIWSTSLSL